MEGGGGSSTARRRASTARRCFQSSGLTRFEAGPAFVADDAGEGFASECPKVGSEHGHRCFRTVGRVDGFASRALRRDECGGGHRLLRFREIARGVDRPDKDTSDQDFACLGLSIVENVGEVRSRVVVEGAWTVSQVPMLISLRTVVRTLASDTDNMATGRAGPVCVEVGSRHGRTWQVVLPDGVEPVGQALALAVGELLSRARAAGLSRPVTRCVSGGGRRERAASCSGSREGRSLPMVPDVGATLGPAVVEVGLVPVEDRGPGLPLTGEELFRSVGVGVGVGEALDGAGDRAELSLDRASSVPCLQ